MISIWIGDAVAMIGPQLFGALSLSVGESFALGVGLGGLLCLGLVLTLRRRQPVPAPAGEDSLNRQIVESAPFMVGVLERTARAYRFLSPYARELLGYTAEELQAQGSAVFGTVLDPHSEVNWKAHFRSLDEGPDTLIAEILVKSRHRSGRRCWLLCRDRALQRDATGRVTEVLSMVMDVTLLMETRERVIESRNQAEAASRAKDAFMTLISHELHTPLNAVLGGAQLLQQEPMSDVQRDCCGFILEGAEALQRLFSDLLEYSQAASNGSAEEILITDEFETLRVRGMELATGRPLECRLELGPDLPLLVEGDRNRLLSVLRHLLENAMKFTEKGAVTFSANVLRRSSSEIWLAIEVQDTGVGFAPEASERIFDPFRQEEEAGTRRFSGTGIGLTIARRHVEMMGGTIEAESEEGQGSRFRLEIPFRLP